MPDQLHMNDNSTNFVSLGKVLSEKSGVERGILILLYLDGFNSGIRVRLRNFILRGHQYDQRNCSSKDPDARGEN